MTLRQRLEHDGAWLFRHRSYLPLMTIPVVSASLLSFRYLDDSPELNEWWQLFCLAISVSGLVLRVMVVGRAPVGTSGRNTREQVAESLTTTGPYSLTRHPLYLGNYLIFSGIALWPHIWWLFGLNTCLYALYYERIILAEEAYLRQKFGDSFERWATETPVIIPRLSGWRPSPVKFCWRTLLQREYNAFKLIVWSFRIMDFIGGTVADKHVHLDYGWLGLFLAGFGIFAVLRLIKKRTNFLNVEGR